VGATVAIAIMADPSNAVAGLRRTGDAADQLQTRLSKVQDGIGRMRGPAVAALAAVGAGAFKAAQDASELSDTISATRVIFEGASKAVEAYASTAASQIGISKQAALDAAGTFGTLGKAAGLSGKDLSTFSNQFVGLAGDLASFKGGSPEEAIEAIGAAMRGESEPIMRYGVLINEASIQATALSEGLVKVTRNSTQIKAAQIGLEGAQVKYTAAVKQHGAASFEARSAESGLATARQTLTKATEGNVTALTLQQKTMAVGKLIMSQTSDAQGDFARTAESAKNQQSRMRAEVANASATLGEVLLPALAAGARALADVAQWAGRNSDTVKTLAIVVGGLAATVLIVHAALTVWAALTKVAAAAQWVLNGAIWALTGPIGVIILVIAALVAGIVIAYHKSETFRNVVTAVFAAVGAALRTAAAWFSNTLAAVGRFVSGAVGWFVNLRSTVGTAISGVVEYLRGLPGRAAAAVGNIGATLLNKGRELISGFWNGIKAVWNEVASWVGAIPGRIASALGDMGSRLVQAGRDLINGFWQGIKSTWQDMLSWLANATGLLPQVKGPPARDRKLLVRNGQLLIQGFRAGISSQMPGLWGQLRQITNDISGHVRPDAGALTFSARALVEPLSAAALAGGAGAPIAGNTINVTLNVAPTSDTAEVGRQVIKAIKAYEGSTGRAVLVSNGVV
jgi:hypothetical protein